MAKKRKPHKKTRRARASVSPSQSSPAAASSPATPPPATPAAPAASATPVAAAPAAVIAAKPAPAPAVAPSTKPAAANRPVTIDRASYVGGDLRRVGILIVACVVLEAILWFLFNHTGLGNTIYSHINL